MKCEICGKEFEPNKYNSLYCSDKCKKAGAYRKKKERIQNDPNAAVHTCEQCGAEFKSIKSKQRFCCHDCSAQWKSEHSDDFDMTEERRKRKQNRPLTKDTVHLVKIWHDKLGESAEQIANDLNRNIETIRGILNGEIK